MKKIFLFFLLISTFHTTFWFTKSEKEQLSQLLMKNNYTQQLQILNKLNWVLQTNDNKIYIWELKKEIISKNLKNILVDTKDNYNSKTEIYKKYFNVLQSIDNEASVNPYYFIKLKNKIHENDIYFKSFIYIYYEIKNNLKVDKDFYSNYQNIILDTININNNNSWIYLLDRATFYFLQSKNYNYLSKNDGEKFKNYILKNKIWTDSKIFEYFMNYINFLNGFQNNQLFISDTLIQKMQEKNLSCEINSASIFASYILKKEISEYQIFSNIPQFGNGIKKVGHDYIWWNPYQEFVWDITWHQTKFLDNMTWYWVYANPISKSLSQIWIQNKVTKFDTDIIIKSLLKNEPIIFWYLSRNKLWELNTKSVSWKTKDGKKIYWYIWEHTGLIVGVSLFDNGNINEIYFYEWKNQDMQILKYNDLKYQASFFDMMITKE